MKERMRKGGKGLGRDKEREKQRETHTDRHTHTLVYSYASKRNADIGNHPHTDAPLYLHRYEHTRDHNA